MRFIKIVLSEQDFRKVERAKQDIEKEEGERVSWERFILKLV